MKIKLGDITQIKTGVYLRPSIAPNANYIQVNDFKKTEFTPTVATTEKNKQHILQNNDILLAAKGEKNFAVVNHQGEHPSYASPSFIIIRTLDTERVLPQYINWHLNLPSSIAKLQSNAVGSAIPSITKQMIEDFEIDLPPIKVQEMVVSLALLQEKMETLTVEIAKKQKQLIDYKLKTIIKNGN